VSMTVSYFYNEVLASGVVFRFGEVLIIKSVVTCE